MIIHVDMDAFYASIEQRDFPELRGKPVLVGGLTGRSVVCAASYESRTFGCRSAMPMREALRRCPSAIVRRPRFAVYRQVSREIREIFETVTPLVEPLALDEAFLDVTKSEACLGSADQIGRDLKRRIREKTGLIASVGIGPVKFVAKLASDLGKPDGFVQIADGEVLDFLAPLPVSRLWGVGNATLPRLRAMGIETVADIRRMNPAHLEESFGQLGRHLSELANGRDPRTVEAQREPKSISHEETFDEDLTDPEILLAEIHSLTDEVCSRLREEKFLATRAVIKVRFPDFKTLTRQASFRDATDETQTIWQQVRQLWLAFSERHGKPIRLVGVGVTGLVRASSRQLSLFDQDTPSTDRRIDHTVDQVRRRFGLDSLRPADSLRRTGRS